MKVGNTFDAHRQVHLAHESGLQDAMKVRLMRAYLTVGPTGRSGGTVSPTSAIGTPDVFQHMREEEGLDAERVRATLASEQFADEVRQAPREVEQSEVAPEF